MIRLDTVTRKLQAKLAGAITTNQLPIIVCFSDKTSTAYTGGTTPSNTNSTTAVDICAAPAASTVRDIDTITIRNADTVSATLILLYNDNGTTYQILTITLAVGDQLLYSHAHQWVVLDSNGNVKENTSGSPLGLYHVIGNTSKNNAGTPNTKFDLSATAIQLRNSSNQIVIQYNPATITNDVGAAGPVANGRDQAGAFSASSWIHFYWIYNGATFATVSSATAPSTGPVLPTGYTQWAYCGAVFFDGSSHLLPMHSVGQWFFYDARQLVLATGTSTVEAAVSTAAFVPPNALEVQFEVQPDDITDGSGNLNVGHLFRVVSGSNFYSAAVQYTGLGLSQSTLVPPAVIRFPNISQNVYYLISATAGTARLNFLCHGYSISQ